MAEFEQAYMEEVSEASHQAFLDKFKPKKTTDDCYTPDNIFDVVAEWAAKRYGFDRSRIVRPFWPGGDYQSAEYTEGCVVLDNPPFSILSQIITWYSEHGILFFLFAPTLTLFSSAAIEKVCALPIGVGVTYANGAQVNTSFVTNMEDAQVRSYPELYKVVEAVNDYNEKMSTKSLPKYLYPDEIITAPMVARLCKYGIEYRLDRADCQRIGTLDAQRAVGKSIFGNGFILSERAAAERAAAERAAAERAAAERAAAERWQLSAREKNIVAKLSGKPQTHLDDGGYAGQVSIYDVLGGADD